MEQLIPIDFEMQHQLATDSDVEQQEQQPTRECDADQPTTPEWRQGQRRDPWDCEEAIARLRAGEKPLRTTRQWEGRFMFQDGRLYRLQTVKGQLAKLWVPDPWAVQNGRPLRQDLLTQLHQERNHYACERLHKEASQQFWWPGLTQHCKEVNEGCTHCLLNSPPPRSPSTSQQHRSGQQSVTGQHTEGANSMFLPPVTVQSIPTPGLLTHRVQIDLAELSPSVAGNNYVMVMVEVGSRWIEAKALDNNSAATCAEVFVWRWVHRYGVPLEVVTGQRPEWGATFDEALRGLGVDHCVTSHQGLSNRVALACSRDLLQHLRRLPQANDGMLDWDDHLGLWVMGHNATRHTTTLQSPAKLFLGEELRTPCAAGPADGAGVFGGDYGGPEWAAQQVQLRAQQAVLNQAAASQACAKHAGRMERRRRRRQLTAAAANGNRR